MGLFGILQNLPKFIRVLSKGEYTGDAVILKSTFGKFEPSERVKTFIQENAHKTPDFSEIDFSRFPKGSVGERYLDFMTQTGLKPFRFSGRYKDLMAKNYLPVFYASVHDFYHVLTGYNTSLAGEAGVWSFVAAQGISDQANRASKMAQLFFPLVRPKERVLILQAVKEGKQMGESAKQLLTADFLSELSRPIDEVRSKYNINPTAIAGIRLFQS